MVFKGLQFIEKFGKLDTRHNSEIRFHFCKYLQLSYYLLVWGPKIILISVQPISWSKLFLCGNGKVQPRYIQIPSYIEVFQVSLCLLVRPNSPILVLPLYWGNDVENFNTSIFQSHFTSIYRSFRCKTSILRFCYKSSMYRSYFAKKNE